MSAAGFGTAKAAKRGRDPRWPFVPIIDYGSHTKQIRGRAYAVEADAVACAQRVIDRAVALHEARLFLPGARRLRESCGLPREVRGARVVLRDAEDGPVGVVVAATADERAEGAAFLGITAHDVIDAGCPLVEWPDGRCWHRPEELRFVAQDRQ